MTEADDPRPRRARRLKDAKRIPASLRLTPPTKKSLDQLAQSNGRSSAQQTEILIEVGLLIEQAQAREVAKIYSEPFLSLFSKETSDRLFRLEADVAGLRAALEKGLDNNASELARSSSRLYRLLAEFEAKLATDTTEMTTAIGHLETVTAHLLAALRKLDAAPAGRSPEATAASPRPRLVRPGSEA